jgi:hypothetical protein
MRRVIAPPDEHVRVEQKAHSMPFPILEFLLAHRVEIGRDPNSSLRSTGHTRLAVFRKGDEPHEWLTITGDHDILACERSFYETRKRALCLMHVYDFGHQRPDR